jgi:hypothetical protein
VAWDTGKDVRLSVRTGKRWLPPAGLDCAAGWQNLFPQLVFAGEDDLYAASWCVRQGLSGRSVFYRLRRGPRSWTADTILRYGSSMFRPPSLASSSSSAAADGTGASVYAVLASPFIRLPRIRDDRIDLAGEVVVQSCGFDLAEGCNGFVTRGEPGVVCAYRMGRHRQAFVLNTRSRAAAGRRPVFLGYGQGYPRAAVDALSGDVCVLFCEGTGARAAVWSPGRDVADDAGRVAEDLHRKQVRMAGRGCGAGAVAARPGGGFWIVYSRSGELWYRSLTLERPPPG